MRGGVSNSNLGSRTVVHLLADDAPGGTQATTLGHVRVLAARGVRQAVVFLARPTGRRELLERLADLDVEVLHLPYEGGPVRHLLRLAVALGRRRAGTVLTHGIGFHLVVSVAARLAGVRRVFVIVGNPVPQDQDIRRRLARRTRLAAPFTTRLLAYSEYVKGSLEGDLGIPRIDVSVLHHPFDVDAFARRAADVRAARSGTGTAVLVMVARLDPIKDHATVVRALGILRSEGRDVELRLVGSGPAEDGIRAIVSEVGVEDATVLLGSRDDIADQLGAADIFLYGMTRAVAARAAVSGARGAPTCPANPHIARPPPPVRIDASEGRPRPR